MAHVRALRAKAANILELHSKLKEYQFNEKYADVTIECPEKIFKCHRLILAMASNFFDTMFSSQFEENSDSKIALPATNAETFEEVIQFIYTGYVSVSSSNVNSLLEASEFFGLPGISDLCTEFIKTHKIGVMKTLNAFIFACKTSKKVLIDILSEDILEHFETFSRADEFLKIPFEGLRTILSQLSLLNTEEMKIDAIVCWVSHNREECVQHIHDLVKMISFGNVTDQFLRSTFTKLLAEPNNIRSLTESLKPIGSNIILERTRKRECIEKNLLHVYVKRAHDDNSMRVFSFKSRGKCTVTRAKNLLNSSPHQWVQSVSLNNYLYRLDYCRQCPNAMPKDQAFSIHTSTNMMGPSFSLKPPPLIFGDVSLCAIQNNIYAYHRTIFRQLVRTSSKSLASFDDEEINRGVYVYNCELDSWFPVPAMKMKLHKSCMVGWNDQILYLIDGYHNEQETSKVEYVQAYDSRVGRWLNLRRMLNTGTSFAGGQCCVHNGKIYFTTGSCSTFQVFDPIAYKRESFHFMPQMPKMNNHQLISYSDELWAVGCLREGPHANDLSVQIGSVQPYCSFDERKNVDMFWNSSNVLKRLAAGNSASGIVVDAVIF